MMGLVNIDEDEFWDEDDEEEDEFWYDDDKYKFQKHKHRLRRIKQMINTIK